MSDFLIIIPPLALALGSSGAIAMLALKRRKIYSIFFAALFLQLLLGLPGVFTLPPGLAYNDIFWSSWYYAISNVLLGICILYLDKIDVSPDITIKPSELSRNLFSHNVTLISLITAFPVVYMILGHTGSASGWGEFRETSGGLDGIGVIASFFLGPMAVINYRAKKIMNAIVLVMIILAVVAIVGTRVPLITTMLAFVIDYYWINYNIIKIVPLTIFGLVGFSLHVLGRIIRGLGLDMIVNTINYQNISTVIGAYFIQDDFQLINALSGGESQILHYYYRAFANAEKFEGFYEIPTLIRSLLVLLPSSFITKPTDVSAEAWTIGTNQNWAGFNEEMITLTSKTETVGSIHFSIWGDAYINLGLLGCVIYPVLLAIIMYKLESIFQSSRYNEKIVYGALFGVSYTAIVRGAVVNGIGFIVYGYIGYFLIKLLTETIIKCITPAETG